MKTILTLLALFLGVTSTRAQDRVRSGDYWPMLATRYGQVFKNVRIVQVTARQFVIDCTGGRQTLETSDLKDGVRVIADGAAQVVAPRVLTEEENVKLAWQWYQWCYANPKGGGGISPAERDKLLTQSSTILAWWRAEQQRRADEAARPQIITVTPLTGPGAGMPVPMMVLPQR